jgi:hypothetical protein
VFSDCGLGQVPRAGIINKRHASVGNLREITWSGGLLQADIGRGLRLRFPNGSSCLDFPGPRRFPNRSYGLCSFPRTFACALPAENVEFPLCLDQAVAPLEAALPFIGFVRAVLPKALLGAGAFMPPIQTEFHAVNAA